MEMAAPCLDITDCGGFSRSSSSRGYLLSVSSGQMVLAIFTGTNNYILILCQRRCMSLCGFNKFIHLLT
jgi:hypothetical protein